MNYLFYRAMQSPVLATVVMCVLPSVRLSRAGTVSSTYKSKNLVLAI